MKCKGYIKSEIDLKIRPIYNPATPHKNNISKAAMSLHYVHFPRASEGLTYLVLAESVCAHCVGERCVCVFVCVCLCVCVCVFVCVCVCVFVCIVVVSTCEIHTHIQLVVYIAAMRWLVKCYDIKKVKSLIDLTIIPLVRPGGGKPTKKQFRKKE